MRELAIGTEEIICFVFAGCVFLLGLIAEWWSTQKAKEEFERQMLVEHREWWHRWMARIDADIKHKRQMAEDAVVLSEKNAAGLAFMKRKDGEQ